MVLIEGICKMRPKYLISIFVVLLVCLSANISYGMQRDPAGPVDSSNLYTYCVNDPVNNTDPTGLKLVAKDSARARAWARSLTKHLSYIKASTLDTEIKVKLSSRSEEGWAAIIEASIANELQKAANSSKNIDIETFLSKITTVRKNFETVLDEHYGVFQALDLINANPAADVRLIKAQEKAVKMIEGDKYKFINLGARNWAYMSARAMRWGNAKTLFPKINIGKDAFGPNSTLHLDPHYLSLQFIHESTHIVSNQGWSHDGFPTVSELMDEAWLYWKNHPTGTLWLNLIGGQNISPAVTTYFSRNRKIRAAIDPSLHGSLFNALFLAGYSDAPR
ncbi:hypothetical protein ACFL54_09135 [Planctomycetota bacterium]